MTLPTDRELHIIRIAKVKLEIGIPLTSEEWDALNCACPQSEISTTANP